MTLQQELEAFFAEFCNKVTPETVATMRQVGDGLRARGIVERALKAGDLAPDFILPNAPGAPVSLTALLASGPVVVSFYRGGWCPYCILELRAYQRRLVELRALGAALVAISPQTSDHSQATAEQNGLQFDVLSDHGCGVARAFGIAFELPESMRALYTRFGHPLPERNATDDWQLPIPATYVIDRERRIVLAHVVPDHHVRLEPTAALAALARIKAEATHAA
jgi:peroxiredoxin